MTIATISSRGQIVIPASIRKTMGFQTGDSITFHADPQTKKVTLERAETIEEMRTRFTALIPPDTPPLIDTREVFNTRPPRL